MFSTRVLDDAITNTARRLEAERRSLFERVSLALASEGPALGLREAFIVGSLAQEGAWTATSDVDVAIAGGDPLEVMRVIEDAAGRAVDVIDLDRHPEPGMFRRRGTKVLG
jgi:predicted nucleotidyltransferase